jgi:hypothetical protein
VRLFPIAVALALLSFVAAGEPAVDARPAPGPPPRVFVAGDETVGAFAAPLRDLLESAGVTDVDFTYSLAASATAPNLAGLDPDVVVLSYRVASAGTREALLAAVAADHRRVYWAEGPSAHAAERVFVEIARDFEL